MRKITNVKFSTIAALCLAVLVVASLGTTAIVRADGSHDSEGSHDAHHSGDIIRVNNNEELAALIASEGWNGTGTAKYPYVIEGLNIDADDAGAAIYIGNTTQHVIVRGSTLHNTSYLEDEYNVGAGLLIFNATNVVAENNKLTDNQYGIYLKNSKGNSISGNNASGNHGSGIYLEGSDGNTIVGNRLSDNDLYGIYLSSSDNNFAYGNIFTNNGAPAQAHDGESNYWNSTSRPYYGNYWDGLTSSDENRDGILDEPYENDGVNDLYPLAIPEIKIEITDPVCCSTLYKPTVLVTGNATPGYPVKVNGLLVDVEDDGTFSVVVALQEGDNHIVASSTTSLPASTSAHVVYVNQQQQDLDDLNGKVNDLEKKLQDASSQLDKAKNDLATTKSDVSGLQDDTLPLIIGAIALIVGLAAIAVSVVLTKRPKAP